VVTKSHNNNWNKNVPYSYSTPVKATGATCCCLLQAEFLSSATHQYLCTTEYANNLDSIGTRAAAPLFAV